MPAKPLTVRGIAAIKPGQARLEVSDGGSKGLFLVVQPSGARSWAYRYRSPVDGRARKLTIGPYPAFGLTQARETAEAATRAVRVGTDPAEARKAARVRGADTSDLVGTLLDEFIARHVEVRTKPTTAAESKRLIATIVRPAWHDRKIQTITRRDVVALMDETVDRGATVTANRVLALVRKFTNWCVERSILDVSPAMGVKPPAEEVSRDRVLTHDEVRWLWAATNAPDPFNVLVRLLLLTGQRRGEVAGMTEEELDREEETWSIPASRTKNGRAHVVPISTPAVEALATTPRLADTNLLFATDGGMLISGWSKRKSALDRRMLAVAQAEAVARGTDPDEVQLPSWRLHDLRRTAASGMARLGHPVHVVEAVLNHRSGVLSGVAGIYNRHDYLKEKRQALQDWAQYIISLLGSEDADNVIQMVKR